MNRFSHINLLSYNFVPNREILYISRIYFLQEHEIKTGKKSVEQNLMGERFFFYQGGGGGKDRRVRTHQSISTRVRQRVGDFSPLTNGFATCSACSTPFDPAARRSRLVARRVQTFTIRRATRSSSLPRNEARRAHPTRTTDSR